jgi:hypothetical protein
MNHLVVVEIEYTEPEMTMTDVFSPEKEITGKIVRHSWNILYTVPDIRSDLNEESLSFKGCLSWIENNKVEGSKYAIIKMYLV